mmetsp:Transcript_38350/g.120749  ORF Transcript_38350/g.120749 Transcript_38350/m.120749 type:complete len:122 (-) Transcript_38350:325-690(-)
MGISALRLRLLQARQEGIPACQQAPDEVSVASLPPRCKARSVWNDALNSAYSAQLSSHKAAVARMEAQKMQDESMRALNSGLWSFSRARADPEHPRTSNFLSSVDPDDAAVRKLTSSGVNV